ncbi:MAG: 5-methyltetrahydropteroyltriglutamate--homocysteine methyltransferase [Crocinitomicaceae bacterium]|jgi:5-methyltetrahydropteroyltriglutamate--homocysteine methyltransferase
MKKITSHIPAYPRIGAQRELKWALEKFWKQSISETELLDTASTLRQRHWRQQADAGLDFVATNDFSFYDQLLDMACTFGIIPERFDHAGGPVSLSDYFTFARGNQQHHALALTKWLNTNYHILVPEVSDSLVFRLDSARILAEVREAKALGHQPKPVLTGPVTLLSVSRPATGSDEKSPLNRLNELLPLYTELLQQLNFEGVEWVQIDEPILSTDLSVKQSDALAYAYEHFAAECPNIKILLASYFGKLGNNLNRALTLPVAGLHIDAVSAPEDTLTAARYLTYDKILSVGIIDGRNIWVNDLSASSGFLGEIRKILPDERIWVSSSCSLQYVPHSLDLESNIEPQLKSWLSFAEEKIKEIVIIGCAFSESRNDDAFTQNRQTLLTRQQAAGTSIAAVRERIDKELPNIKLTRPPFVQRQKVQSEKLQLPLIPTTTIGSFPQTDDIRQARAKFRKGQLSHGQYEKFLQLKTRECIEQQEAIGLDVLVHGEFERNDMVEYFASGLEGFAVSDFGWVQSYGSRCTKPPIIWGDVRRPLLNQSETIGKTITVEWTKYAQSVTDKPVKGMLTGATTILQWSFYRDDLPRTQISQQISLALRDEVLDLEKSGVSIIQVDEAALREGLPLRADEQEAYLAESRNSFLITTSGVNDSTQIHTHMCYSQFDAIFDTIVGLDADVISIEASRSKMALLETFTKKEYPNEIGLGIWDIHSPRVPSTNEMKHLLELATNHISLDKVWANPDCGLKTRGWEEVSSSLENLVSATEIVRSSHPTLLDVSC